MTASLGQLAGIVISCGAAASALLLRNPRHRAIAIAIALIAAPLLVAGDVWHQARFAHLRSEPALLAAAVAASGLAVAVGAAIFRRIPAAFPVVVFAALPFRVPVSVSGQSFNLLVPLYFVIAAGAASYAYGMLIARNRDPGGPADEPRSRAASWTLRMLAVTLVLYALQSAYSQDVSNAIKNVGFFLVPFAVLLVLMLEVRWSRRLLGWILLVVVSVEVALAAVAFWEYASRNLILNQKLLDANQLHLYFRVNSVFFDPNVFGRYLALTLVAIAAYVTWESDPARGATAIALAGILLVAMTLTFSITSIAALIAGILVVAALRFGLRWGMAAGTATLLAGTVFLVVSGTGSSETAKANGGGHYDLVKGGVQLAEKRPVWGWGSGSFGAAFERHIKRAKTVNSHSEPITVAAEQGAIGLVVYLALIAASLWTVLARAGPSVGRLAVAGCFVALIVHSLGYGGFIIDPATWSLIALGIALPGT